MTLTKSLFKVASLRRNSKACQDLNLSLPQSWNQETHIPGTSGDVKETFKTAFRLDAELLLL